MRALVMTEPSPSSDRTVVREVAEPSPGPREVTIEVAHAGINFIDVMTRRGDPGYASSWPYVPGLEVAGTVRAIGAEVHELSVGQRVAGFTAGGGLAEVALVPIDLVVAVPDEVTLTVAAAAPLMLSTALLLLTEVAPVRPGDSVLMHSAAGGVGSAVAQLVPILGGGRRIGTVGAADKIAEARRAGWDIVIERGDDLQAAIRQVAGKGVDIVLDPSGTRLVELDVSVAAPGARIALFGNPAGGIPGSLPPLRSLIAGNLALAGFSISRLAATDPGRVAAALRRVLGLIASRDLDVAPTVLDSLDGVAAAHDLLVTGRSTGKYVVRVGG